MKLIVMVRRHHAYADGFGVPEWRLMVPLGTRVIVLSGEGIHMLRLPLTLEDEGRTLASIRLRTD